MKMKLVPVLALLCVCVLGGCTIPAQLYPVQGPLASQTPPPIFSAKITGGVSPQTISTVLSNGETFAGTWVVPSQKARAQSAAAGKPAPTNLAIAWDTVYGQGFYSAHVLGAKFFAQSAITGDQGTVLQVEIYRPVDDAPDTNILQSIKGVAQDSHGNIYKLVL